MQMQFNKQCFSIFGILLLFSTSLLAAANTPPNLDKIKQELIQYHDSGQYNSDIHAITKKAMQYVKYRVSKNKVSNNPKKLAAIFDIDETSLSNYPAMVKMGFGGKTKAIVNAEDLANDRPIGSVLRLYNYARKNGVTVFFVTGRKSYQRQATIKNLRLAGYKGWKALFMKRNDYDQDSVIPYKSSVRERITKMGYDIILNIGDQWSDLKGRYSDKKYKLPDPYYYIS